MIYKSIFSGRLEFGNARSFEQVLKFYEHRRENYYKLDIIFKSEDIFFEESTSLDIPRFITQAGEKTWRNTVSLLEQVAQFAIAGDLSAWMIENGKIVSQMVIEPQSDKMAVQAFIKGRELIAAGLEDEAKEALDKAIEKFERHALAYERRGFINLRLRNYTDALYDYSKSIDINPNKADAYFGRAFVRIAQNDYTGAIADLEKAAKTSIPLQPIHWKVRRVKAECHLKLQEYANAITELKLVTNREFTPFDSNYKWRRKAWYNYGQALLATGDKAEAIKALQAAIHIPDGEGNITDADIMLLLDAAQSTDASAAQERLASASR